MAFIAYLLVSAGDEHTAEKQKREIQDHAGSKKIRVDNYITVEIPSRKGERGHRIKELFSGVNRWDTVMVSDLSLIGQDLTDIIKTAKGLAERGVRFIAAKQDMDLNGVGDASSKAVTGIFDMLAGLEKDIRSSRIKDILAEKKKEGVALGRPKGSISSSKLDSKKELIIDYLSKGVSKASLARILETSPSNLLSYLKSRKIEVSRIVKAKRATPKAKDDTPREDISNDAVRQERTPAKKSGPAPQPDRSMQPNGGQHWEVVLPNEDRGVLLCRHCGRNMLDPRTTTCAGGYIDYQDGESHRRVPYPADEKERCPRCGVAPGGFHHDDCYFERCPRCGERLVSCGCKKA